MKLPFTRTLSAACILLLAVAGPFRLTARDNPSVTELEAQLATVQAQIQAMQNQVQALQDTIVELNRKQDEQDEIPAIPTQSASAAAGKDKGPSVTSQFGIHFYGKIKTDFIHDTNTLGSDELITFIPQFADGESQTSFTARETRLGLSIGGPRVGDWSVSGRFESDFYGSAQSGGSGSLRIRLAYAELANGPTSIRVGQDWIPVASMNPSTTNFTIMGYAGNLWNRVPQVTVRQQFDERFSGLISVYRYRDADDTENFCDTDLEMPWIGGKLGYIPYRTDGGAAAFIGFSGAWRKGDVNGISVNPTLLAVEFNFPSDRVDLKGEIYWGNGLGPEYLHKGGAFNTVGYEIETHGGFVQLGLQAAEQTRFHIGYGLDNPRDEDVLKCGPANPNYPIADNFYRRNSYLFGNITRQIGPGLSTIMEGTWVDTDWSTGGHDGFRLQGSMIYVW